MKKYSAGFGLILLVSIGFAQTYHITDFIPDSLKTWQVYGTLSSSLSGDDSEAERKDIGTSEYTDEDKNSTISLTPTVYYKYIWLTPNQEFSINSNIQGLYERSNNRSDQNNFNLGFSIDDVTNKYIDGRFQGIIEHTRYLFCQNRLGVSVGTNFNLNENNRAEEDSASSIRLKFLRLWRHNYHCKCGHRQCPGTEKPNGENDGIRYYFYPNGQ